MAFNKRPDGTLIRNLHSFRGMLPFLMRNRTESIIYFEQEIDVTETLAYIKKHNKSTDDRSKKMTVFHVFLCAFVRSIALRPQLNRFVSGYRYYQRNELSVNFVAKKTLTDDAQEINVKIAFDPKETLESLAARVNLFVTKAKSIEGNVNSSETDFLMKFPRSILRLIMWGFRVLDYWNLAPASMIRVDPMYSTLFLANLGSVGIDAPYHHLFEWGTNGAFAAIGKIKKVYSMNSQGEVIARDVVKLTYTLDDRISEGIYCARAIDMIKKFVEKPAILSEVPDIPQDILDELNLNPIKSLKEDGYV
jgi:2-oxoacid dehydrogenases acyltransferase (catalytic domain)